MVVGLMGQRWKATARWHDPPAHAVRAPQSSRERPARLFDLGPIAKGRRIGRGCGARRLAAPAAMWRAEGGCEGTKGESHEVVQGGRVGLWRWQYRSDERPLQLGR